MKTLGPGQKKYLPRILPCPSNLQIYFEDENNFGFNRDREDDHSGVARLSLAEEAGANLRPYTSGKKGWLTTLCTIEV